MTDDELAALVAETAVLDPHTNEGVTAMFVLASKLVREPSSLRRASFRRVVARTVSQRILWRSECSELRATPVVRPRRRMVSKGV